MTNNPEALLAHDIVQRLSKSGQLNDLALAKTLWKMKRFDLWRFATGGIDRWEDYLKQPEINISVRKANQLIRIAEHFQNNAQGWDLSGVPIGVLDYIAKRNITDHKEVQELLLDGAVLSMADFKEKFHDTVAPDKERTYTYMVMQKCDQTGNLKKVHDISSDEIKDKFSTQIIGILNE